MSLRRDVMLIQGAAVQGVERRETNIIAGMNVRDVVAKLKLHLSGEDFDAFRTMACGQYSGPISSAQADADRLMQKVGPLLTSEELHELLIAIEHDEKHGFKRTVEAFADA